jgi:hypothetical protein
MPKQVSLRGERAGVRVREPHRQQLIREDLARFRVRGCSHSLRYLGDQAGQRLHGVGSGSNGHTGHTTVLHESCDRRKGRPCRGQADPLAGPRSTANRLRALSGQGVRRPSATVWSSDANTSDGDHAVAGPRLAPPDKITTGGRSAMRDSRGGAACSRRRARIRNGAHDRCTTESSLVSCWRLAAHVRTVLALRPTAPTSMTLRSQHASPFLVRAGTEHLKADAPRHQSCTQRHRRLATAGGYCRWLRSGVQIAAIFPVALHERGERPGCARFGRTASEGRSTIG